MEKLYCKTKISTIALILLLTVPAILVALPPASAQQTMETYAFIGVRPNPVGVNQEVLIHIGITQQLSSVEMGWEGLSITIERPDGETETISDIRTDSTGGTGKVYAPTIVGTYYLQSHFPEQVTEQGKTTPGTSMGAKMLASSSQVIELEVLPEDIPYYPAHSLPTEYWTRPIDAQLRELYAIAGNWLYSPDNRLAPYNEYAPETAHILWTKPLAIGGLVGGDVGLEKSINQGAVGMEIGDAYEGKWSNRLILCGRLYYAVIAGGMMGASAEPVTYHCVDLHTGEELWSKVFLDNQTISFGQTFYFQSFNYQGTFAYLWIAGGGGFFGGASRTWHAFDASSGNWAFTFKNMPSGTTLRDENGGLNVLIVNQNRGWMALWNMTKFVESSATGYYVGGGSWGNVVNGKTFDASAVEAGCSWNATIPKGLPGTVQTSFFGDRVIGTNLYSGFGGTVLPTNVVVWGLNLKQGEEGTLLFNTTWATPSGWIAGNQSISWATWSGEDKVGILWSKELRQHYGVSLETGELLWGPTPSQHYLDMYEGTMLTSHLVAYGRLYASGVGGILYCYNATTGDVLWTYEATDPYTEYLFGNNWWLGITFITDGKLYVGSGEHSPNQPLPRGAPFLCLNATDGDVIWRADGLFRQTGWGGLAIIGDSIIATMDTYDQRIYAIGRGASQTEVWIQNDVISQGNSVMIRGRVTDVSPGTEDANLRLRFPDGVPAVSDEDMSEWMLYVYKQFECPEDVEGVEVFLKILDPNGDWYSATVTTDRNGRFSHMWAPAVVGEYHVTAMFEGSESYYPSQETTTFGVDEAPEEAASAAEIADTTVNQLPEIPAYLTIDLVILIIVAVGVVIGIVVYMALRKQK